MANFTQDDLNQATQAVAQAFIDAIDKHVSAWVADKIKADAVFNLMQAALDAYRADVEAGAKGDDDILDRLGKF